ncbi:DegT/DnrJ/EryC1/StrS family aminotransferase [Streptomyces sp. NBC_00525]|uniref:DegT/DnrJ/EryC1/StrS family aminotransferase n=1 Tax=Streptomyces sp. NBC_00525 TaxID=2903660 RepID=UPI002E821DC8|nr:DegT/DnrJ/EryC1/StrS family aminotransferase [Streptomyces sp. NBC_00525]WUC97891.1 DegT/DnrJ/EryC1/StrS family aminotransferase [Streptomyces sp. NBC_00525]
MSGGFVGELALTGGEPVLGALAPVHWPRTTDADRAAVLSVLDSNVLVSDRTAEETAVERLERSWADYLGVRHCVGVSNGTTAIELALLAHGVGPGDEVVVPALTFVATAMAVVHVGATPVYADIDPVTFTMSPDSLAARITERTRAVVPVHLHGLSADLDPIGDLARRHGCVVVEDAAQSQGARYRGVLSGASGNTATFSLQMTKNLPTCGEGGLVVTDDERVAERIRQLRQFGETIRPDRPRRYVSHRLGFNAKLNNVQAAYTSSQLERFDAYREARRSNVTAFLARLRPLEGLTCPSEPDGYEHAWHILRFVVDFERFLPGVDTGAARNLLMRALRAEGMPATRYQMMPVPDQPALRALSGRTAASWPVAQDVVDRSFTLQQRHLPPDAGPVLQSFADAVEKVWSHRETLVKLAEGADR